MPRPAPSVAVGAEPRRSSALGPYELLRALGRGGFAEVWLARRSGPGGFESLVALKMVRVELRTDPAFQHMFMDEAKLAARINHPNVVRIFELGEVDDVLYLVMEYIRGRSLNELANVAVRAGRPIPPGVVMRILADTCAGLHAAHELERDGIPLGVIHRDVSPQNILVSDSGAVKLIDFGVAKANDRLAADTTDGHTKGKLRYMSPEQAMAKPVDRRADIWAVGAVAFELLEGRPPYEGHNDLARLYRLMDPGPPPAMTSGVPAPVERVIARALQRDPDERWQTAADMRAAIEAALEESNLRVNSDAVKSFFGAALAGGGEDEDEDEDDGPGDGLVLRDRLKRTSLRAGLATVDVEPPAAAESSQLETSPALDTSPHGARRAGLSASSRRAIVATTVAVALVVVGFALGLRPGPAPSATTPARAAPVASSVPPPPSAAPEPPPAPLPLIVPSPLGPAPAIASSVVPPPVTPPPASDRKRTPVTSVKPARSHPVSSAAGTTPGSRPRYDDTIQ